MCLSKRRLQKRQTSNEQQKNCRLQKSWCYLCSCWCCPYLQSLTAQACSALWTGTGVVGTAGGAMLAGRHTWGGHRCKHRAARVLMQSEGKKKVFNTHTLTHFTETSSKSFGTAAPVEAHTHATVLTRFLTLNRLWRWQERENTNGLNSYPTQSHVISTT